MFSLRAQVPNKNWIVSALLGHLATLCLTCVFAATILEDKLSELSASFHEHFQTAFPIPADIPTTDALQNFSKAITANLLGGVGYFYGTSIVDKGFAYEWDEDDDVASSDDDDEEGPKREKGAKLTEPKALLTATPSRSFFPRGFYWCIN